MLLSGRERALQSVIFETLGLLLAAPLYQACFGRGAEESFLLVGLISLVALVLAPLHNAAFDSLALRLGGAAGVSRSHRLRMVHAVSHEVAPILVTMPLVMLIGRHGIADALTVNLGLTALYVAYAFLFYLAYDRLTAPWRRSVA
jgi:uncharacterized membrane protein